LRGAGGEEGSFYNCMASILFCALMFEAYVNHIGIKQDIKWGTNKRLGIEAKLKNLGLLQEVNLTEEENLEISGLISLGNSAVHGRTEIITQNTQELPYNTEQGLLELQSSLKEECTSITAKRKFDFFTGLIERIRVCRQLIMH